MNDQIQRPPGAKEPSSLREARKRLAKVKDDMKNIEMQLADPHVSKDGERLPKREWEQWRSRALHALRRKQQEHNWLSSWLTDKRVEVRANEAGISNPSNPNDYLSATLDLLRRIRKSEALDSSLSEEVGRLAQAVDQYLTTEARVG